MTRSITLPLVALGLLAGAASLPAAEPSDDAGRLAAGLATWETLKEQCGGNYSYTVGWSSAFGFGHVTEIVVRDNKVVARKYEEFNRQAPVPPGAEPPAGTAWTEEGEAIGSHQKGAPAKTLDELYAGAKEIVAKELAPHERRYVRLDKQGLPTSCFTIDTRIADDAPRRGIYISSIKLASKDMIRFTGKVVHNSFEGGFYGIVADDGGKYDPINLPAKFKKAGQRVSVVVKKKPDAMSFRMWGTIVEIIEIKAAGGSQ
jgi:hypothetical protein